MGELKNKRIVQSKIYLDDSVPIPDLDYDYSYPITIYDAVKRNMDEDSPTLNDELDAIYRLINSKQDIIDGGIAGQIMTWTGIRGEIGSIPILKNISTNPEDRSHDALLSERAIGMLLDKKTDLTIFNDHRYDNSIHVSDLEKTKWNQMTPLSSFQAHTSNMVMHITKEERALWNGKANQKDFEEHIYNYNNPHNTTAHQVGTYTRREIDDMFENLRESFFNYKNIFWDDRNNQGSLVDYDPALWNPNFILEYDDTLPDVPDATMTYFALKPATDYTVNETQDCIIYIKSPGLTWQEIGFQNMVIGDMVIKYPETTMYVWVQGRFMKLFAGNSGDILAGDGTSDKLWKPIYNEETGELTWELQSIKDGEAPEPMMIKGQDGYTPIKGVDYDDGKDGEGVAPGGHERELLIKLSDENYDTGWRSIIDIFNDMVLAGEHIPPNVVIWDNIEGRPMWYDELGDNSDGFITQRAATRQFTIIGNNISDLIQRMDAFDEVKQDMYDHMNDFNNPHRVTPTLIGAVPLQTFMDHIQNFDNPHHVTADQVGLGNVDNTSDLDKPISNATQNALDELLERINNIIKDIDNYNAIVNVVWDNVKANLIFTYKDGTELEVHIPIPDIFQSIYFDDEEKELVIVLPDGTENRIDISALINIYFGSISPNIQVTIENDNVIKATVIDGTIGEYQIAPSVHLRMSPTTTTQVASDRSTRIATTEFVKSIVIDNLISYETDRPLSANMGRILNDRKADIEDVIQIIEDMEGIEVIDNLDSTSPVAALSANMGRYLDRTKAPRVHTSPDAATFGRATIQYFGHTRASDIDPLMDGTVFRGTDDGYFARGDHRHPTDITRAPIHWPDEAHDQYEMTGEPKAVTPPDDSNDHRIVNTEWVRRNAVGVMEGKCPTASSETIKIATLESTYMEDPVFLRQIGSTVTITFENGNTAINPQMDVHESGPAPIIYGGKSIIDDMIKPGYSYIFTFDGENWLLLNPTGTHILPDGDNSNSLISAAWARRNIVGIFKGYCVTSGSNPNKVAGLKSSYMDPVTFIRQIGSTVAITFSFADKSGADVTTLNVEGTGAAPIIFGGFNLYDGMLGKRHTHEFVFDGENWRLINPVPGTGYGPIIFGPSDTLDPDDPGWVDVPEEVINKPAGYTGFTTPADGPIDNNGRVQRVWFNINYDSRSMSPTVIISDTPNAFTAKMGDGSIMPLSNPKVISSANAGAVIQFTMSTYYPSDSPCQLIYRTNKATITVI